MLITRYLLKEIGQTFLAVLMVVLLIALSNKFIRYVAKAAMGEIAPELLWQLLLFQIPDLIAFFLPIALFLAILLGISRLYTDHEMQVMFACGFSWKRLVQLTLAMSLLVSLGSAALTCFWGPQIAHEREKLLRQEGPLFLLQTVSPGRFHSIDKNKLVFYINDLNEDRSQFGDLFIAEYPKGHGVDQEQWSVLTAKSAEVSTDPDSGLSYITLEAGRRYHGIPGQKDYSIVTFKRYRHLLENPVAPQGLWYHRTMPTKLLWQNPNPGNLAELQWRLAVPISALLLALLALPLSQVSPRQGRYGRLFLAILICIVYYNLLTMSKRWVAKGLLTPVIGLWWVHLLLLVLALWFLAKGSGRAQQATQWIKRRVFYGAA